MTEEFPPRSILLVEDEPRLRQTLQRSLTGRGYRVDLATTVAEASARALSGSYDVMLLDVNLPDATGWDVLRTLRQAGSSLPSIVLSAAPPNPARVREFRPAGILYKPFPMDALLRLIQSACSKESPGSGSSWSDLEAPEVRARVASISAERGIS
jgi:two-component system, OmpR family, copper resistance phosphate regulon response regulator CusR